MTHLVPDQCEAVSQPWAGHPLPFAWRLGAEALPLPAAGLQLVQLVGVLSVLDHAAEDEDARAVHHEAVGGAPRRDVALHRRHEPLVGGCNGKGELNHGAVANLVNILPQELMIYVYLWKLQRYCIFESLKS